ncbi:MAG: aquaporin [Flavobacteriales bacterium]|nr:aquaporin [Flavobacteriales bacterium]
MLRMKRQWVAELIGTFALVFFGTGAVVINSIYGELLGHIGISAMFGLIVMVMIYAVGDISGAHLNPAVTIGFSLAGRFPGSQVSMYILAQGIGAIAASALLWLLFPETATFGETIPVNDRYFTGLGVEVILTFVLMMVILSVSTGAKEKGITAAIAIGATVTIGALFGGPVTGASMNPARTLGPAIMSGHWNGFWIYLAGPLAGVATAVLLCRFLQSKHTINDNNA